MKKYMSLLFVGTAALTTAACGGDNDGPSSAGMTPPDLSDPVGFTSFSDVEADSAVEINGISQEISFEEDGGVVTSVSAPSSLNDATYTTYFNDEVDTTAVEIETPNTSLSFSASDGDSIEFLGRLFAVINEAETEYLVGGDPYETGWDYQSFGVWQTGVGTGGGTGGAFSVGAETLGNAIPTSSSATFVGVLGGLYVSPEGETLGIEADLGVAVDFAGRTATLSSSNSQEVFERASYPGLDASGTLTWNSGSNEMSGTLVTANGRLSGDAAGRFYGPAAEELGGVFTLTSGDGSVETFSGGFGAVAP